MGLWHDYIASTFMYNMQILPDAIVAGMIILAVLLANQSLFFLAAGGVLTQLFTGAIGRILMKMAPENAGVTMNPLDGCHGGFLGKSWESLLNPNPDHLWYPLAPSRYMALLGFFGGVGAALQQLYKEEIDAGIIGRNTLTATSIISILVVVLAAVFRYFGGCDTISSIIGGLLLGLALGYFGYVALGYASGRRLTNVWGIPLLRDRINNGSALYICPGPRTN
jgi:hypothetical protein